MEREERIGINRGLPTMDEDVINIVKSGNSQEQVTLSERMEELEEEVNMVSIETDKEGQKNNSAEKV